jgi:undecaprenyl-phosphate galactose phosphotransferase
MKENNANFISKDALEKIPTTLDRSDVILQLEEYTKRAIDIIGSIVGIILLVPLTICIYIANFVFGDRGPIFYTQERIGQNGKLFKMYKYRSMVVGADEKLKKYLEENEEAAKEYKKYKKLKKDPRITKIGKFIRKTSIDEFPQFVNVLKGDMSLVGPRPYLPREKKEINGYFNYITSLKPGITGFWQVNGRSNVTFVDRLEMDMQYYFTHSLKLDIKLLWKTVEKIFKKNGAI